ncbi:MAG: hypothetical protein K5860_12060 [Bacteroidales bacterium]|nr:hypothetical protein [Bacteroidales bacterium]
MKQLHSIGAVLAACFYITIMVTFGNDCIVTERTYSSEKAYIDYVETQIGSQKIPSNTIASLINICKSPVKKIHDDNYSFRLAEIQVKPAEYAYFCHPIRQQNIRIFSNTDIIYPFNYFL